MRRAALALALALLAAGPAAGNDGPDAAAVFDHAWRLARDHFYDPDMHGVDWEAARERHRRRALLARGPRDVHEAITALLGELGASHAMVIEPEVYRVHIDAEAKAIALPRYGLALVHLEGGFFVGDVLPGSVAHAEGVRRGDRVVAIDGATPRADALTPSPYEAGLGGPRVYRLVASKVGQRVVLELERARGDLDTLTVELHAAPWSEVEATRVSRRVVERCGVRVAYIRLYHVLINDPVDMLEELIAGEGRDADALVVDLRGSGGLPKAAERVIRLLDPRAPGGPAWGRPAVALTDRGTRSAKELLAFRWRERRIGPLVGERTRGAVLGATFFELADGAHLMLPVMDMRAMTGGEVLEKRGVAPDIAVEDRLPWSAGHDPIYERGLDVAVDLALARRRVGRRHGWY